MTIQRYIFTLCLAIFLASSNQSCNNKNNQSETIDTTLVASDTIDQPLTDTFIATKNALPEIFLFKYSQCIENCNDNERIVSMKEKGDSLFLKIGSIQNCIGKFRPEIKAQNDTLSIDIKIKEEIRKMKNGKTDSILVTLECDCYFYFDIGIKNLTTGSKTILLNGQKIGNKKLKTTLTSNDNIIYPKDTN